jgi:hypothetical protein
MDDILRLPFVNDAEIKDIISKVYTSIATKVSIRDLQKVNIYRIESPRLADQQVLGGKTKNSRSLPDLKAARSMSANNKNDEF